MIKFGTDGWRGIIADDFTFENVRRVAGGIASYVLRHENAPRGVIIGYDTRFLSQHAARQQPKDDNLIAAEGWFTLNAGGNYIHAPGKFVAALGVNNLVVVETDDALLITTRDQAQEVGKVVKYLDEKKLRNLV